MLYRHTQVYAIWAMYMSCIQFIMCTIIIWMCNITPQENMYMMNEDDRKRQLSMQIVFHCN